MENWISIGIGAGGLISGLFFGWSQARPGNRRYMRLLAARIATWAWMSAVVGLSLWVLVRYLLAVGVPSRIENLAAMLHSCVLLLYVLIASVGPQWLKGSLRRREEEHQLRKRVAALESKFKNDVD